MLESPVATTSPSHPKKTATMVYCAYCGKSFTRKEHLERHIPSRMSRSLGSLDLNTRS
jgi:uncharacterized Zn-finger protein